MIVKNEPDLIRINTIHKKNHKVKEIQIQIKFLSCEHKIKVEPQMSHGLF